MILLQQLRRLYSRGPTPWRFRRARTDALAAGLAFSFFFSPANGSFADEIILKNGKIIEGTARRIGNRVVIRPWDSDASIVLDADRVETILQRNTPFSEKADTEPEADDESAQEEPNEAANTMLDRPSLKLDPGIPEVQFSYVPRVDAQVKAAVETVFPQIVSICVEELGMTFGGELALNIQIFDDLAAFDAFKSQNSDLHYAVEGYYAVNEDHIVVWGNEHKQKMVATIYHEGTHAILRREFDMIPSWIDEGLAEFFEGFRVHGDSAVALSPTYNDGWAKRFLLEGDLIALSEYFHLTNHEWVQLDQSSRHVPRIMAWSLVAFLMSTDEGRHALRRYVQAIKRAPATEALATAYQELDSAYRGGVTSLERDWKSWVLETRKAQTF